MSSNHRSTDKTPLSLLFGRNPSNAMDVVISGIIEDYPLNHLMDAAKSLSFKSPKAFWRKQVPDMKLRLSWGKWD
jgi:hypothetical protein